MNWLLEAYHINKSFAGIQVLNDVSFNFVGRSPRSHGGERSRQIDLAKVLSGLHRPDHGEGSSTETKFNSLARCRSEGGIGMVRRLLPFLDLSVAENVFIGQGLPPGFSVG
jgi:ribose transport system ATP-binding protein